MPSAMTYLVQGACHLYGGLLSLGPLDVYQCEGDEKSIPTQIFFDSPCIDLFICTKSRNP